MDDATFCSFESGCEAVTSSVYGKPLGIPLPIFGLAGFAAILGLTLVNRDSAGRIARWLAIAGAAVGISLIVVQFAVLERLCPLCLVADVCAIGLGVLAVKPLVVQSGSSLVRAAWSIAAVLAVLLPLSLALADATAEPPDWVQAQWVEGKVNVVEVTDFECEHCKRADEYVREVLQTRSDVNFVRMPVPMPKHANSRPAAIAFQAAKVQGRGNEMAEALFAAPSRSPANCRKIAEELHLNMAEYDRVVSDPATDQEVTARSVAAKAAGPGVPLIWIQSHVIYGSPTIENFDGPFRRARPYRIK
jgi:uncharacterized membrane protein